MEVSRKTLITVAAAVAVLGIVAHLAYRDNVPRSVVFGERNDGSSQRLYTVEQRLSRLAEKVDQLAVHEPAVNNQDNRVVNTRLDQLTALVAQLAANQLAQAKENAEPKPPLTAEALRSHLVVEQQQVAETQQAYRESLEVTFDQELIDEAWSTNVTTYLDATFQSPELVGGQLISSDCRDTMCKVEILHEVSQSEEELFMFENHLVTKLAAELTSGSIEREQGPDGIRTIAFFARNGHHLPKPEQQPASFGHAAFGVTGLK